MNQLGNYEIIAEIGRGGFGIVYQARDLNLDRFVALKVLHPQLTVDPKFVRNFKREAQTLARIEHPNVVTINEVGEAEGRIFISMQYLAGGSLASRIAQSALSREAALPIIEQVAAGLAAGHKKKIIHRDVKPGNILFDAQGNAVIADFGVARAVALSSVGTTAGTGGGVGTPFYRPPELWRGTPPPSPATDVYSLACVLFEMLTGVVLFDGASPDQILTRHILEDVEAVFSNHRAQLSPDLVEVLMRALEKSPVDRFASMSDFTQSLQTPLAPPVIAPPEPDQFVEGQERVKILDRLRRLPQGLTRAGIGLLMVLVVALGVWGSFRVFGLSSGRSVLMLTSSITPTLTLTDIPESMIGANAYATLTATRMDSEGISATASRTTVVRTSTKATITPTNTATPVQIDTRPPPTSTRKPASTNTQPPPPTSTKKPAPTNTIPPPTNTKQPTSTEPQPPTREPTPTPP